MAQSELHVRFAHVGPYQGNSQWQRRVIRSQRPCTPQLGAQTVSVAGSLGRSITRNCHSCKWEAAGPLATTVLSAEAAMESSTEALSVGAMPSSQRVEPVAHAGGAAPAHRVPFSS